MSTTTTELRQTHLHTLRRLSFAVTLLTFLLTHLASRLPLFDSSPRILLASEDGFLGALAGPLLRWDAFHFVDIALKGHSYDYEWAFFPGGPLIMRGLGHVLSFLGRSKELQISHVLVGGALGSLACRTTSTLYDLTMHHFGNPSIAYLTCLLSLLPSSPATLWFSVYNEPYFTYFSYRGMLYCAQSQWQRAAVAFTLASMFRSNGIMLAGYILWGLVVGPLVRNEKVSSIRAIQALVLTSLIFTPFALHQYHAYRTFCLHPDYDLAMLSPWCYNTIPSIYNYVQSRYWNIGFLRYWTLSQLPNILLAAPVLLSILSFSITHIRGCGIPMAVSRPRVAGLFHHNSTSTSSSRFTGNLAITPHVLHATALSLLLLFAAHTQIALRLAPSIPVTYWAAAWLMVEHPRAGKWWVGWSVVWGALSVILWTVFLPPA